MKKIIINESRRLLISEAIQKTNYKISMLLRLFSYLVCAALTWQVGDLVFLRNFAVGVYQADGSGLALAGISRQALIVLVGALLIPTALPGNAQIFNKLVALGPLPRKLILALMAVLYLAAMITSALMIVASLDRAHIELSICYTVFLVTIIVFFGWDALRVSRRIYKI